MKAAVAMLVVLALLGVPGSSAPQSGVVLLPEQSSAKAREVIERGIAALGGPAYLGIRDITCSGRLASFDNKEELGGYSRFVDFTKLPNKNRTEYFKQRNIITVRTPEAGWDMDRGGVVETPADSIAEYKENLTKDLNYLFRFRMKEEGLVFRYQGVDILDLKRVEWVEVADRQRRTIRIAFDVNTHLPMRAIFTSRDPKTRERQEETSFFANFHAVQGVMTPLQEWRERNGKKFYQAFFEDFKYNTGLDDALFTRESLEQRFAELNKGKKKK